MEGLLYDWNYYGGEVVNIGNGMISALSTI
jgi:hypothetical protein